MLNCTEFDGAISDVREFVETGDVGVVLVVLALLVGGGALLVAGERLMRPLGALVAGTSGAVAVFILSALLDLDCEVRLVTAGLAGLVSAVVALCILGWGIFLVGSAALAALTHLVYDALPLSSILPEGSDFVLLGRSGYYYLAMVVAVLVGGVASYVYKKNMLRIASSLLGSSCVVFAVNIVAARSSADGEKVPPIITLGLLLITTTGGVAIQRWCKRRGKRRTRVVSTNSSDGRM